MNGNFISPALSLFLHNNNPGRDKKNRNLSGFWVINGTRTHDPGITKPFAPVHGSQHEYFFTTKNDHEAHKGFITLAGVPTDRNDHISPPRFLPHETEQCQLHPVTVAINVIFMIREPTRRGSCATNHGGGGGKSVQIPDQSVYICGSFTPGGDVGTI